MNIKLQSLFCYYPFSPFYISNNISIRLLSHCLSLYSGWYPYIYIYAKKKKKKKNNLAGRSGSFYVVRLVGFDYRGSTAKGCKYAHSPLLTEIRRGLVLRGVARAVHVHSCLRKLLFVTTPQLLL